MCGIIGYTGNRPAAPILIEGLKRLEYRGYDSAGIAVEEGDRIQSVCRTGKIAELERSLPQFHLTGSCGIGHTRWATHGVPSEANAHPHLSCDGSIAIVHNGIIENHAELRRILEERGHTFLSQTDSEVIVHLIEDAYSMLAFEASEDDDLADAEGKRTPHTSTSEMLAGEPSLLAQAVSMACGFLIGSWAICAMVASEPGKIVCARKESPLVIGRAATGVHVASDVSAISDAVSEVAVLADGQIAELDARMFNVFSVAGDVMTRVNPETMKLDRRADVADRGQYADFMIKEIHEQPRVIRDTLEGRFDGGELTISELALTHEELNLIDRVCIIACGTSYHAALVAKNLIEGWARIPCEVEVASEFRYRDPIVTPSTLVVAVSQSGETADTLAAIRDARIKGAKVFGITNVLGSPVARESDGVIYTKANKEVAVASTKSFTGQLVSLTLLAMLLAQSKGRLKQAQMRMLFSELSNTAAQAEEILKDADDVHRAALACKDARSAMFIGRGMGAAVAEEGALKLKEISYLHAEAYPAGEMKHGPIALIEPGFPLIAVATESPTYEKVLSNIQEAKTRGAMVVAIATEGDERIREHADHVIHIPKVRDAFSPITAIIPLQLLARDIALLRGCNIDQPRNLAKSVTVE